MAKKHAETAALLAPGEDSNYTVLARRYRPQQFKDLVGQEPVAQALVNALQSNRVAHAYLFTGARGVGKTSTARILAKALNCVNGPTPTPCGRCEACQAIAIGEDVDVLEIDGASNNKVEEVRELRQNAQYRPSRSRYKIYIIDEVHMLSTSAFNALLKTLEEPPPHVKFIFATTEVQKIPVTILSRCQRFDFAGIGSRRITERLQQVVREEGYDAEPDALEVIARRAAGSMRDAQSLLDQLLAFGGERLTVQQVYELLGMADEEQVAGLAQAILQKDVAGALGQLSQAAERSVQFGELLDQLLSYWRDLLVLNAGGKVDSLTTSPRFRDQLQEQAKALSLDAVLAGMDILAAAKARLRGSSHGRVLVEMALVRLCRLENLVSLGEIAQLLSSGTSTPPQARPATAPAAAAAVKKNSPVAQDPPASNAAPPMTIPLNDGSLQEIWRKALAHVGPMLSAELEKAERVAISAPNCLVLHFPLRYNREKDHCQEPGRNERLEEALRKITGQAIGIRYALTATEDSAPRPEPEVRVPRAKQIRTAVTQEPLVRLAMEKLGAQLVKEPEEGFGTTPSARPETESEEAATDA